MGELAAATSLLSLQNAVMDMAAELRDNHESAYELAVRLEQTYGTINAPVGIRAQTLIKMLRALEACVVAIPYSDVQVAPYVKQVTERRVQYGPARRQMPIVKSVS